MKKIICITENLGSGGAERQLTGLAVMLKEAGYEVKFITYIEKQFHLDYLLENGVEYELLSKAANKYTRVYYLYKAFKQFKADVVISFLPSVNISVCLTRFFLKYKLIVSERSSTQQVSLKDKIKFLLYHKADYVVANSYSETNNISNLFPSLNPKLRTITNFIDTDKFCPAASHTESYVLQIITVGRIIPLKNTLNYIRAIRQVVDKGYLIKAVWIGDNYDTKYYEECLALIEELGLKDIFIFKPQTNNIVEEYQKADIFCLPSFYEGFPNVICEAMSCGLPIVCSDVCENPKIVEQGKNGFLFDPKNVNSICSSILKLITDIKHTKIRIYNRELSICKFDKMNFLKEYVKLVDHR
ncbi:MAG: glycosyltransferase [Rikenellaceae bacterium]